LYPPTSDGLAVDRIPLRTPKPRLCQRSRNSPRRALIAAGLLLALLSPLDGIASGRGEIEVKAAFLFNFARFISWPDKAFFSLDSPVVIGILGDAEFFEAANAVIKGKTVNNRLVETRELRRVPEAKNVHILFIGRSLQPMEDSIRTAVGGSPVFMISDSEGSAANGGMAHFYMDEERVRFALNSRVAQANGLTISSKLLRVATLME